MYKSYCDSILHEIDGEFAYLKELEDKYDLVAKKTGELHQACEKLVQEQVGTDLGCLTIIATTGDVC